MPARKLPPYEVLAQLAADGLTYRDIAPLYGMTPASVEVGMRRMGLRCQKYRRPIEERFWEKVDRNGPIPEYAPHLGNCWLWTASDDSHGYGQFMLEDKVNRKAYSVAWELTHGPIPDGLELDHLCRVTMCVRPEHLEPVTPRVNVLRSRAPSAVHAAAVECVNGHPFDEANTYLWRGRRYCKPCNVERNRQRMEDPETRAAVNARRRQRYAERKGA